MEGIDFRQIVSDWTLLASQFYLCYYREPISITFQVEEEEKFSKFVLLKNGKPLGAIHKREPITLLFKTFPTFNFNLPLFGGQLSVPLIFHERYRNANWGFYHKVMHIVIAHISFLSEIDYTANNNILNVYPTCSLKGDFVIHMHPFFKKAGEYNVKCHIIFPSKGLPINCQIEIVRMKEELIEWCPQVTSYSYDIFDRKEFTRVIAKYYSVLMSTLL